MKKLTWEVLRARYPETTIQSSETVDERMLIALFGRSRRSIVSSRIKIPKKKSEEFWKIYHDFQGRKRDLYSGLEFKCGTVSQQSDQLPQTGVIFTSQEQKVVNLLGKTYGKYFKRFKKLLDDDSAARLLQLEMQMDCAVAAASAHNYPANPSE